MLLLLLAMRVGVVGVGYKSWRRWRFFVLNVMSLLLGIWCWLLLSFVFACTVERCLHSYFMGMIVLGMKLGMVAAFLCEGLRRRQADERLLSVVERLLWKARRWLR